MSQETPIPESPVIPESPIIPEIPTPETPTIPEIPTPETPTIPESSSIIPSTVKKIKHLCLSGGGLKGLAYIGAYKALLELKMDPTQLESITGTSIGAFFGFLVILGYTADELYSFVTNFEYSKVKNINFMDFFQTWGIESAEKIIKFFQAFMRKKTGESDLTFSNFYKKYPIKFTIVASNLKTHSPVYFNHENTPDEYVIWTIRRSMNLPLFFKKIYDEKSEDCWVDGGLLDNFPIQMCPDTDETLGIYCDSDGSEVYANKSLEDYFMNIFQSVLNLNTKYKVKNIKHAHLIRITIDRKYSNAYHIELNESIKKSFYNTGYQEIMSYFSR
jgi:NTE family protein